MKDRKLLLSFLLVFTLASSVVKAQKVQSKAFKEARYIRIYVEDSSEEKALIRFSKFIDKTGFISYVPEEGEISNESQDNSNAGVNDPNHLNSPVMIGDTIYTDWAVLYDFMFGDFDGQLKFYPMQDDKGLCIVVTGFVGNNNLGGNFLGLQMQKGGNANWAQKTFFKQIDKHVKTYTQVKEILYSDQ